MSLTLLIGLMAAMAFLAWLSRRGERGTTRYQARREEPIDRAELERAEREVQELDLWQKPDEPFRGYDWGPGTSPRPPHDL